LPNSLNFEVASNTRSIEPLIFIIPFSGTRPDTLPPNRRQPINHPTKLREITKLCITLPSVEPLSLAVQALDQSKFVTFSSGEEHFADIEFDGKTQAKSMDFRPIFHCAFGTEL
jgi:hypothetical protein